MSESDKEIEYQVYYTTDLEEQFSELLSVKKKSLKGKHIERIYLPVEKIVQFRFDFGARPGQVSVSDMTLEGENIQPLNFDDFSFHRIDSKRHKNQRLTIVSYQNDPLMIYQKPLKILPKQSMNWCVFFLLLCIFGSSSYLIFSYLRNLKNDCRSGVDIVFVSLFGVLLYVPMMHVSEATTSSREQRRLAVKPHLFIGEGSDIDIDSDYGKKFDAWFNDRFFGRPALIKLHDVIRNKLSNIVRTRFAIYSKKNGWEFCLPHVSSLDCRPPSLQVIAQTLIQLDKFCRQNQIKLYILEAPKKESVYKEILSDEYGFDEKQFVKVSQAQETIRSEVRNNHIPYVYPYNALRDASRQDFVFFQCSHHWTDWGAFVGYYELMKKICKDFPGMPIVSLDDYQKSQNWLQRDEYSRDYRKPVHLSQFFNSEGNELNFPLHRVWYNYYDHKNGSKMMLRVGKFTKEFVWPEGKYKVMLIGTSSNENLLQFLPYSAAHTKYLRLNMGQVESGDEFKVMKLYKKDILAFKPDILILSIHTDNLPSLRDLCSYK